MIGLFVIRDTAGNCWMCTKEPIICSDKPVVYCQCTDIVEPISYQTFVNLTMGINPCKVELGIEVYAVTTVPLPKTMYDIDGKLALDSLLDECSKELYPIPQHG